MSAIPYSSASARNQQPILDQLLELFPTKGTVLEVGSGTGQHAVYFTRHMRNIYWQATDRAENLTGLEMQFAANGNPHILIPLKLDVLRDSWPDGPYAAAFSANTAHIMCWQAVQAMFEGVAKQLLPAARFCLYGPFNIDGAFTSASNAQFDRQLRLQDSQMGIREMADLETLCNHHQLLLEQKIAMPANNFILVFSKKNAK